jgi:transposase
VKLRDTFQAKIKQQGVCHDQQERRRNNGAGDPVGRPAHLCLRHSADEKYSAEEKIRIVLEGLRGESTIAELCRREGIHPNMYYKWSKEFLEAGKQRLTGDTQRQADNQEVQSMRTENEQLKQLVAELSLKNRVLKKSLLGRETPWDE